MSCLPDPATNAYRKDLADVALAGRVIASHYAESLQRHLLVESALRSAPSLKAAVVAVLRSGEEFLMLDCTCEWAWGYASDGRVGYVAAAAVNA